MVLINGVVPSDFQDLDFALSHIAPQPQVSDSSRFDGYLRQALAPESSLTSSFAESPQRSSDKLSAEYSVADDSCYPDEYSTQPASTPAEPIGIDNDLSRSDLADQIDSDRITGKSTGSEKLASSTDSHTAEPVKTKDRSEVVPDDDGKRAARDTSGKDQHSQRVARHSATGQERRHDAIAPASTTEAPKVRGDVASFTAPQTKTDHDSVGSGGKVAEITVEIPRANTRTAAGAAVAGRVSHEDAKTSASVKAGLIRDTSGHRGPDGGDLKADTLATGRKASVQVVDLRRGAGDMSSENGQTSPHQSKHAGIRVDSSSKSDSNTARSGGDESAVPATRTTHDTRGAVMTRSTTLGDLSNRLREQTNAEIVRSARLVIRGNESGEIRLHLKPETLGNVRILLEMRDGHVAGRIIVENSSVRDVFEQNMPSLNRAFREEGIELDSLDVAVSNPDQGSHGTDEDNRSAEGSVSPRSAAGFGSTVPDAELLDIEYGRVNLVV